MVTRLKTVILVLILGVMSTSLRAQNLPEGDGRNPAFLSYMAEIEMVNPQIRDFTKMQPGTLYKLPNGQFEELGDFDTNGIWGKEFEKAYRLSYDDFLQNERGSTLPDTGAGSNTLGQQPMVIQIPIRGSEDWKEKFLEPLLLAVLAAIVAYGVYFAVVRPIMASYEEGRRKDRDRREQAERRAEHDRAFEQETARDPVTSGPPMVPGGIAPTEPERLSQTLHDQAAAKYSRHHRVNMESARTRIVRIGPIEYGMISGSGVVGYLDWNRPRIFKTPQPGYRARFRFPDGSEQYLMSLEGCMNPCYNGDGLVGFTFTPNQENGMVAETPSPAPPASATVVSAPGQSPLAQPVVPSAPAPAATVAPTVTSDKVQFLTFVPADEHQPAMIRWKGLQFRRFDLHPDGTHVVRFDLATPIAPVAEQ
ncbi:MAG: hypothetical protein AB198_02430 [Parcubacteria bacterium C7867-003]|nr:MAG: hypothetical protein AB198_02430 [Parcubacteria bacterium C7867-003]